MTIEIGANLLTGLIVAALVALIDRWWHYSALRRRP